MSLATASGAVVGRTVPHSVDGSGVAQPISTTNPMPTAPTSASPTTVLSRPDAAETAAGNSGALAATNVARLAVDLTVVSFTGGTAPTITFLVERQGADGKWYQLWTSGAQSTPGATSTSIGDGCTVTHVPTGSVRLRWTFGGTVAPTSVTFSASIIGR